MRSHIKYNIKAIDLFCGAGGLTHGLKNSGINVALGIDIDPYCEFPYKHNNDADFLLESVENVTDIHLSQAYGNADYRILAGCAPCQTFSTYNQKAASDDKRWWLLKHFSRLISEVKPEIVTMENVPGLIYHDVFQDFIKSLKKLSYSVDYKIVNCYEYGLPQKRRRLVLLASLLGEIKLLNPVDCNSKYSTVKDAIGDMPPLKSGEIDSIDPLHSSSALSEINLKRIKASKQNGTWRDWPEELLVDCHKKKTGKTYPSVYGRMGWNNPAPTMTTQFYGYGNGRFGHPEQDRAISLREGAILQGFPRHYKFARNPEAINRRKIGCLIGNAVPVRLGEVIGESINKHMEDVNEPKL